MARRRRREIPWEIWSAGLDGSQWFCVEHFRLASLRARAGKSARMVPIYSSPRWADRHAEKFGHHMAHVSEAEGLARRLAGL